MSIETFKEGQSAIAFFDALGTRTKDTSIETRFEQWEALGKTIETQLNILEKAGSKPIIGRFLSFSDSLFVMARYDDAQIDSDFLGRLSSLLGIIMLEAFKKDILFRGALSCKSFSLKGNMVLGQGVQEAYTYHEITNWVGFSASPSAQIAILIFRNAKNNNSWQLKTLWYDYDIPMKNISSQRDGLALNWFEGVMDTPQFADSFKEVIERILAANDLQVAFKLLNTLHFMKQVAPKYTPNIPFGDYV